MTDAIHPTLCIDEADNQITAGSGAEMKAILNSGHYRATAYVGRMVADENSGWLMVDFNTFTAMAFAGIERLPETLQSRSIVGYLQRASRRTRGNASGMAARTVDRVQAEVCAMGSQTSAPPGGSP